jgi:hypothetical protein
MYTVQRCRKDDTLYGPVHYWNGLNETLGTTDDDQAPLPMEG